MAGLGSGDGPLSVRARPSSIKRDCDRGPTSTGEKCLVNVHAKSRLTLEPLRTLRSETKGQAGACPDRTRAIPCKVRAVTAKSSNDRGSSSASTVAKTVAMTADNACSVRTTLECWPSTETAMDGPGRCAHSYGSEGQGHVPTRARPSPPRVHQQAELSRLQPNKWPALLSARVSIHGVPRSGVRRGRGVAVARVSR